MILVNIVLKLVFGINDFGFVVCFIGLGSMGYGNVIWSYI